MNLGGWCWEARWEGLVVFSQPWVRRVAIVEASERGAWRWRPSDGESASRIGWALLGAALLLEREV